MLLLMRLIMAYYDRSLEALNEGVSIEKIVALPVREEIGRYKYTQEADIEKVYQEIMDKLDAQIGAVCGKEDF
jgi:V/A-type H+-transporting ATPase subunit A